jgi:hypothetical protein
MSQYDARVKAARETIAAHECRISSIAYAIQKYCAAFWVQGDDLTIDFCPVLSAYAHSKDLDPELLESEMLYKAMIPTMFFAALINFEEGHDYDNSTNEWREADESNAVWMEAVHENHGWELKSYDHEEFVTIAHEKGSSDAREPLITKRTDVESSEH